MFKKLLVATVILGSSGAAIAGIAGIPYVGAGIGVIDTQMNTKDNDLGATYNFGGRSPNFNIFGGYSAALNQKITLGGEIFAETTAGSIKAASLGDITTKYRTRSTYGVSLIPGLMLSEQTMLYGRVGLVRGNFNIKDTSPSGNTNTDESLGGGQAGVGVQTNLTQNLDVRGEYVYSAYRSFTVDGIKTSPTSDQFNVSLIYKFE